MFLQEFYVVTRNRELWVVKSELASSGKYRPMEPIIEKIDSIDSLNKNTWPPVGTRLCGGRHVGITRLALGLFDAEESFQLPEHAPACNWGGKLEHIAGLFLQRADAENCMRSAGTLVENDARFHEDTDAVVERIGMRHPLFRVAKPPLRPGSQGRSQRVAGIVA